MKTIHNKRFGKSKRNIRNKTHKRNKTGKKWITAIGAAETTYSKTHSLSAAKTMLRKQSLINARKLFGSIGTKNIY